MFRQRLRLPHHLTFGVLPRISGRPQRPSCSRSRTRFPGDRRTLLPLGSALTFLLLASHCFPFFLSFLFFIFLFFFAPPTTTCAHSWFVFSRDEYYPGSFISRRSESEESFWFFLWPLNFSPFLFHFDALQCSYLQRLSSLSPAYEVNLIVRVFLSSVTIKVPDLTFVNYRRVRAWN